MAIANLPKLNFSVPLSMTAALPVEFNAYFSSYDDAVAAAQTAEAPGSSSTVYYYGQKIVVVSDSSADLYIIQPDKTLKAVGSGSLSEVPVMSADTVGGAKLGNGLKIDENSVLSVDVATEAEADNTKPITSAAVNTLVGNIDALLSTI
jgi:hypothetical protein